jgi:hypothetical protein
MDACTAVPTLWVRRMTLRSAFMLADAAISMGVALGAHTVVAFGPQVFLCPQQRRSLALPFAVMDMPLEALQRSAKAEGIALEAQSLIALLTLVGPGLLPRVAQAVTRVVVHVGTHPKGDLLEARMLQEAVRQQAMGQQATGLTPGLTRAADLIVDVHEHTRHGHNLAFALRTDGYLEPLLAAHIDAATPDSTARRANTPKHTSPAGVQGTLGMPIALSVAALVLADNNAEIPPLLEGGRPRDSHEVRLENVRRVNAGLSTWTSRS